MSMLKKFLGALSGGNELKVSEQLLFDKVIGFRGIVPGVGTSTIVQNVAIALSENTNCTVCVLDMNCLYPTQYPMLVSGDAMIGNVGKRKKDIFEFSGDVSEVVYTTSYRNVYVTGFTGRTVVDMLSSKDSDATFNQLIGALKSFFDIILIDLSYELTAMNTQAGVKCNKIINIADQSLKCVVNLKKSLNASATLAIPFAKSNVVVLNKIAPDLVTDTKGLFKSVGLGVISEIPFSLDVLKAGVSGKRMYSKTKTNEGYEDFNCAINELIKLIINPTPLTLDFYDLNKGDVTDGGESIVSEDGVEQVDIEEVVAIVESKGVEEEIEL